jgi:hypothetical protein
VEEGDKLYIDVPNNSYESVESSMSGRAVSCSMTDCQRDDSRNDIALISFKNYDTPAKLLEP